MFSLRSILWTVSAPCSFSASKRVDVQKKDNFSISCTGLQILTNTSKDLREGQVLRNTAF